MRAQGWLLLVIALAVAAAAALAFGTIGLSPRETLRAVFGQGDATSVFVVRGLRLPRTVLAMLLGAGLGISGAALQGVLRNPLAEPYLLGVSGGAAVGAVLAVSAGVAFALVPVAAFAGAIAAVTIALSVARATHARGDPRVLVMAGVVVGAFANAAIMVLMANADASVLRNAVWWMMGSVADATWTQNAWLAVYVLAGSAILIALGRTLDALALGEDSAAGLGVDVERAARRVYLDRVARRGRDRRGGRTRGLRRAGRSAHRQAARRATDTGRSSRRAPWPARSWWWSRTSSRAPCCRPRSCPWAR